MKIQVLPSIRQESAYPTQSKLFLAISLTFILILSNQVILANLLKALLMPKLNNNHKQFLESEKLVVDKQLSAMAMPLSGIKILLQTLLLPYRSKLNLMQF
jgi:hypothetical protein